MTTKTAYHWDDSRVFCSVSDELESPQEPGVFYPPGNATYDPVVLPVPSGMRYRRLDDNSAWLLESIPTPPPDAPV